MAVLGEAARTAWYALAGADVHAAEDAGQVQRAWTSIDADTVVVVVTPMAAAALSAMPVTNDRMLLVTLPPLLPAGGRTETAPGSGT
ncbi:MAG TPA: hypothetical protein VEH29_14820 [Acidimicrobiales bacterium]|nr:hypothetical protein [Acidimicrobiales bacterium]